MGAAMLLWSLGLLSLTSPVISDPHYLLAFPAVIQHPSTEMFCVLLRSLPETVHLVVTLEMRIQNHTLLEKDVEKPGVYECTSFQVPPFPPKKNVNPLIDEEVASVHVLIQKGNSVSFEDRKKVLVRNSYTRHIIESDKPFYKPGETVRFRIVRFDDEFKAIDKTISLIQLKDPNENRIGQWVDVKPHHGIVDLSFPLASEAALGTYSIEVGRMADIDRLTKREFTVEEYELPKFEVLFEFPSLVTTSDEEFQVNVCSKYTYGKPVSGKVHLTLIREASFIFEEDTNETLSDITKEYTGQTDKTGCVSFTINGTDINLSQKGYLSQAVFYADLEEKGTGVKESGSDTMAIAVQEMNVGFSQLNPFYKQGFPYAGKIIAFINESPVKNWTVYLTVDVDDVETHIPYVTDDNGEADFSLDTTNWKNTIVSIRSRYSIENVTQSELAGMMFSEDFKWLKPFYSESNSFLEIQHVQEEIPCGKDQEVLVDYILDRKELGPEADHVDFYYLVLSKGKIVSSGQKPVPVGQDETLKGTFSLTLLVNSDLAPTAWLLLYAVFPDGEVAADVDEFTIDKCFKYEVTLGFSEEEELPGSNVNLQIEASPGALCSLRAVDKSVALKENATLTAEKVFEIHQAYWGYIIGGRGFAYRLEDFEPYPCLPPLDSSKKQQGSSRAAPWYQSEADVYSLFKQLRMKILTNTKVKKPVSCELPQAGKPHFKSAKDTSIIPVQSNLDVAQALNSLESKKEERPKARTYFPEAWIWDLVPVNEEGKAIHSVTIPDTITEWNADAFCVADVGFGLSRQATLRVFQPFFVDLALPYSVIRGETFQLKATVFNYLKDCIQVRVKLLQSQDVEVKPCPACQLETCLCADEAQTFSWNVTATQLGHVNFSITAEAEETHHLCGNKISTTPARGRSDTVVKALLVKPEGILEEETHNVFLCSSGDTVLDEVSLKLPEAVVKDSGQATISAIGDILGTSLEHIDRLVQIPLGCGEQNLMKFVPNIFILQYLEKTNQAAPPFKKNTIEFLQSGYQRQLLYKHDNGSYSAFGKRDAEGNTWLTASVAKAFGRLKSYIYVDEQHIEDAVGWLRQHQLPSGCFENVGRVFNNAVKGGVDDGISLTAYIAASLLELHLQKNGTMVDDALLCLKKNLSSVHDAYPKALLAYVFTMAGDRETRQSLLKDLDEQADKTEGTVSLSDMETTAYFLLAVLSTPEVSTDDINYASKIVPTLTKLQNPYGGFTSTQNTVLALQALSAYAALTYRETEDVKVLVKSSEGFQHDFHVDKKNRLVLQQASLPEVPGQYSVEVSGNGCVYMQTILRYHEAPPQSEAFALSVETSPKECNQASKEHFDILLQVSYTGTRNTTNMVLIEVNMLSGYIPVKKSVKKEQSNLPYTNSGHLVLSSSVLMTRTSIGSPGFQLLQKPLVKKVEFEPDKISIYLDQLDKNVQSFSLSVDQETEVVDLKPATVKVYDYYHPVLQKC
ncbi:alpha-2-macroglobulin-like protein 1 isoform X4 [Rhineura floridana]|uniref:alpha-2-macroglobulin-like protein 1 isoform X4 n=1 Tax=Rhineura floridana TaxID=261503 RepID=UPI002AC88DB1|nr:alpha-2-macroglobulin-like protein 1 isoform X4 [Rhineura floridana]